jgi:hypothetical protein
LAEKDKLLKVAQQAKTTLEQNVK